MSFYDLALAEQEAQRSAAGTHAQIRRQVAARGCATNTCAMHVVGVQQAMVTQSTNLGVLPVVIQSPLV